MSEASNAKTNNEIVVAMTDDLTAALSVKEGSEKSKDVEFTGGDGVYEKHLPEGLTKEHVEKLDAHNHNFAAATGLTLGRLSAAMIKDNPEIETSKVVIKGIGKTKITGAWKKSREGTVNGKPYASYGSVSVGISDSTDVKTGQIGIAFEEVAALTQAAINAK